MRGRVRRRCFFPPFAVHGIVRQLLHLTTCYWNLAAPASAGGEASGVSLGTGGQQSGYRADHQPQPLLQNLAAGDLLHHLLNAHCMRGRHWYDVLQSLPRAADK